MGLTRVLILFLASPTFSWHGLFASYTFTALGLRLPFPRLTLTNAQLIGVHTFTFLRQKIEETDFSVLKSRA